MIVWEADCKEVVVLLVTLVVWILAAFLITYKSGSRAAVVTVCNIHVRYSGKNLCYALDGGVIINYPECVSKTIWRYKVVFRFAGANFCHNGVKFVIMFVGEEYRLNVGIVYTNMLHAVLLLVTAGELMFLDFACHVVINVGAYT